ncbi:IS21 family transposase, partial [Duganella sp. FT80W]|nr:IS21 family transposase [Duganella guangzhouensis]
QIVADGKIMAEHERDITRDHGPGHTIYNWRHYLAVVQRKPGALRNGAPFVEMPAPFRKLQSILLKRSGGDREMVDILALVLLHDEKHVLAAVEHAIEAGTPSKQIILNTLSRLLDGSPAPLIDAPQALALDVEPIADFGRYDQLRQRRNNDAT